MSNKDLREKLLRNAERLFLVSVLVVLGDFANGGLVTTPKLLALGLGAAVSAVLFYVSFKLGKRTKR